MKLKELKAALDEAARKLAENPDDAALKTAHAEAKSAYEAALASLEDDEDEDEDEGKKGKKDPAPGEGEDGDEEEDDSLDESKLDPKTKAYIAKLRKENAKHRTKAKNARNSNAELLKKFKEVLGESDEEDPEVLAKNLKSENEGLALRSIVLEQAVEYGVGKDAREFFEFFVGKKFASLEEGEELSDEDFAEAAKLAKKAARNIGGGDGGGGSRTSVDDTNAGGNPNKTKGVTLEQFKNMTVTEKSDLFIKNRTLYDELFAQANPKRRQ